MSGSALPSLTEDAVPDLVALTFQDRAHWLARWTEWRATLPRERQSVVREQMRRYWFEQWKGTWGSIVSSLLTPAELAPLRAAIAVYWQ